jgi:tetratricopeptide (TPR) repeat protein
MGEVYEAQEHDPPRRVALKLLWVGGLSFEESEASAHFAIERVALARMDHPNVARVYKAGVTADRVPFFAMELVDGPTLMTFCDARSLSVRDRLRLFVGVCKAVQHAHQKGVIHRDLKPGNILVTEVDGVPTPKVIDFGVAKLVSDSDRGAGVTRSGAVAGTPLYMAPEQANPFAHVDTRADVYALGVILFELLTGRTPLDQDELKALPPEEVLSRVYRQVTPPPSEMVLADLAARLRGDLDWIVGKCLRHDPDERYATADQLAEDIERYSRDEPVSARPPGGWYLARKFVRRHRGTVAVTAAMLALLVAGSIGTGLGLVEAMAHERRAYESAAEAEANARAALEAKADAERAKGRAEEAAANERTANALTSKRNDQLQASNRILTDVFIRLNPSTNTDGRPLGVVLGEQLVQAADLLDEEAVGDPLAVAHMQMELGLALSGLGHQTSALNVLGKAHRTFARELGPDSRNALATEFHMADCHRLGGNLPRATEWHDQVRGRRAAAFGDHDPDTLVSMNNLAICYRVAGQPERAVHLYEYILRVTAENRGPDHPETVTVANNLGVAYSAAGQLGLARPLLERTLAVRRERLPEHHLDVLNCLNNLGECLRRMGEFETARELFDEGRRAGVSRHGTENPMVVSLTYNQGLNHLDAGHPDLALPLIAETYQRRRVQIGAGHAQTLEALTSLIQATARLKQKDAVPLCQELVTQKRKALSADDPRLASVLSWAGWQLLRGGLPEAAEGHLRECLALVQKVNPTGWQMLHAESMLGEALLAQRKYADAEPLLTSGYAGLKAMAAAIPGVARRVLVEEALDRLIRWARLTGDAKRAGQLEAERATLPREELPPPRKAD